MGNQFSLEEPAKAPQRLSKSRAPSHQYGLPTNLPPPPDFASCYDVDTRYRHCYLAASRPLLHIDLPSPTKDAAWDSGLSSPLGTATVASPPWQPVETFACAQLDQAQRPQLLDRADSIKSCLKRRLSRANSLICQTGSGPPSLARSHSVHSNGHPISDLHHHPARVMDSHRQSLPSSLLLRRRQNSCPPMQMMTLPASEPNSSFQMPDVDSQPSSTHGSPARSSFIPVRQRSLYLTPGVATRAVRDCQPVQAEPPITEARCSYDSDCRFDFDQPVPSLACLENEHRPVTPCEANYRQLGGIEFGTLRITNGSPISSPAAESDDEVLRRLAQIPNDSTPTDCLVADESSCTSAQASSLSIEPSGSLSSSTDHAEHGSDSGKPLPSPPASLATDRQSSPGVGMGLSEKRPAEVELTFLEVLDVRDDPDAKPLSSNDTSPSSAVTQTDSAARSDSGFASASTSSRNSSQRTVSKSDSGFSSTFSIPSTRSDCVIPAPNSRDVSSLPLPPHPPPKDIDMVMEEPGRPARWRSSQSTRSAISSMSREVLRRFSGRSTKSSRSLPPDYGQTTSPDGTCWPSGASPVVPFQAEQEDLSPTSDRRLDKQGRLLRLLSGGRKQSTAEVYLPCYSTPDDAPAVPVNLREKLHTRIGHMPTVPKKDSFRLNRNPRPLQTILSVESLPIEQEKAVEGSSSDEARGEGQPPRELTPPPPPPKSIRFGPRVSASLSPKMLIRRKPVGSGIKSPVKRSKTLVKRCKTAGKPPKSPLARSPVLVAEAAANPPAYQKEEHTLWNRASLPGMAESLKTRPLPPVPPRLQLGTVKTSRDLLPSQAVLTMSDAQDERWETLDRHRWIPPQRKRPQSVGGQAQLRQLGKYHDDEGHPKYRVLHSYNSPAYKNVRIWG
ncbi:hypothetical protein GQ602_000867 [Ophiocordyceps camponoti-floridani]|uniref:Uncharacterized protein n=1 Tax=Ophiocordyceps camponoti-floridani TaxID=2030778 RepID=A0A8H4QCY7_9HYPO|nr:hypothetical protein GQ602_000867 [Ophiocordyceps camponoti-floridani]